MSDVHGNLPAFEAVLADIERDGRRRALVPRRPRRLRRPARRVRRAGQGVVRSVPDRQPRPRRDRQARHRRLLAQRRGRGALDAGATSRAESVEYLNGLEPHERRPASRPLPRAARATRSGSTSSRRCRPTPAWTRWSRASARSATRTWRSTSRAPRAAARSPASTPPAGPTSTCRRATGSSTRAAWASRATATRAPPGCCSTWRAGRAELAARRVPDRRRRARDPAGRPAAGAVGAPLHGSVSDVRRQHCCSWRSPSPLVAAGCGGDDEGARSRAPRPPS